MVPNPPSLVLVIVDKIDEYHTNSLDFLEIIKYIQNDVDSETYLDNCRAYAAVDSFECKQRAKLGQVA